MNINKLFEFEQAPSRFLQELQDTTATNSDTWTQIHLCYLGCEGGYMG